MAANMAKYQRLVLIGLLLALAIGILWPTIVFEIQPFENALRSVLTDHGERLNALGFAIFITGLLALPVALVVTLWPMLRKEAVGKRHIYAINLILAPLLEIDCKHTGRFDRRNIQVRYSAHPELRLKSLKAKEMKHDDKTKLIPQFCR